MTNKVRHGLVYYCHLVPNTVIINTLIMVPCSVGETAISFVTSDVLTRALLCSHESVMF
jgi:hypothetical protein